MFEFDLTETTLIIFVGAEGDNFYVIDQGEMDVSKIIHEFLKESMSAYKTNINK